MKIKICTSDIDCVSKNTFFITKILNKYIYIMYIQVFMCLVLLFFFQFRGLTVYLKTTARSHSKGKRDGWKLNNFTPFIIKRNNICTSLVLIKI